MALCRACLLPSVSRDPSGDGTFLSMKTVQYPSLSGLRRPPVAQALVAPPIFTTPSSKFADVLGSISSLHTQVGEESRAADEYMQRSAEENGRSTQDYERRALLFERSGEMVASSKLKGEQVKTELELLQVEVLDCDDGRTAADYLRRAQIFSKSAEVFCKSVLL